eukprot:TRINITY_DN3674_c0_g1_i3.p2 TRINITY_DN3674_c0_g1~~TRINITY_DN3674_c0_g1_i3.p2  ORF type:complete len:177 (-),score=51.27 TRINITY_DN3674_c0_g1_i3:218-748(-)
MDRFVDSKLAEADKGGASAVGSEPSEKQAEALRALWVEYFGYQQPPDEVDWTVLGFSSTDHPLSDLGRFERNMALQWILWLLKADNMLFKAMQRSCAAHKWPFMKFLKRVHHSALVLLFSRVLDRVLIAGGSHSLEFIFNKFMKKLALDACSAAHADMDEAIMRSALPASGSCCVC